MQVYEPRMDRWQLKLMQVYRRQLKLNPKLMQVYEPRMDRWQLCPRMLSARQVLV